MPLAKLEELLLVTQWNMVNFHLQLKIVSWWSFYYPNRMLKE